MHPSTSLLLLLAAPRLAVAQEVVVDRATWQALQPATVLAEPVPGPYVASRDLTVRQVTGGLAVSARFDVRAPRPGWIDGVLIGGRDLHVASVTWNGAPAPTRSTADGLVLTQEVTGPAVVLVEAFLPSDPVRTPATLTLWDAPIGRLDVVAPGLVATVAAGDRPAVRDGDTWVTGAGALSIGLSPPRSAAVEAPLVVARAGIGLTVGDAEVRGRARLQWIVRRGGVDRVSFLAAGLGADLAVSGPNVREVRRSGELVEVLLQERAGSSVELDLRWTGALPAGTEGRIALPRVEPRDTWRTETALQLARDGEVEVVPALTGWEPTAAGALPEWGRGLVEGTPTAAWRAGATASGHLDVFRFEAVSGPPAVIDVAAYDVASSEEGRLLMSVRYEVRNERAPSLALTPPAGMRILGVRVSDETALPFRDAAGAWRIPLVRSVDTVEGLLSFPVEVTLLGEDAAWKRTERRGLALPVVDAPIAASRVTLYLPPGFRSRVDVGDAYTIAAFSEGEGLTYGFGLGDPAVVVADQLYKAAVSAWMDNDFSGAQGYLDELGEIGAGNDNTRRLQSNLDVIDGKDTGGDVTAERRVKDQARMRASSAEREADELSRKGDEAALAGDYGSASSYWGSALSIQKDVAKLEQDESVEVKSKVTVLEQQLVEIVENKPGLHLGDKKADPAKPARDDAGWSRGGTGTETAAQVVRPDVAVADAEAVEPEPVIPAAPSPPQDIERDDLQSVPVGRSFDVVVSTSRSSGRGRGAGRPDDGSEDAFEGDGRDARDANALPEPEVHASALSVTVPAAGEAVRYQQLLLPAHAAPTVFVHAKDHRRSR